MLTLQHPGGSLVRVVALGQTESHKRLVATLEFVDELGNPERPDQKAWEEVLGQLIYVAALSERARTLPELAPELAS